MFVTLWVSEFFLRVLLHGRILRLDVLLVAAVAIQWFPRGIYLWFICVLMNLPQGKFSYDNVVQKQGSKISLFETKI